MKWERIVFLKKKNPHPPPPPPPPEFLFYTNLFFFNVGNSMKREENMKYWRKKNLKILFFSIFKKFIQNSNNIPSISKTIQHTPMTWCTYLQSFEKIHQCVFWVRKLNVTDRRTERQDRRTDGGRCNISRPGPSAPREIINNKLQCIHIY